MTARRLATGREVDSAARDGLVDIDGEQYYRIGDSDSLDPFLMSVVSDGDRWMFVSSGGALTAGRRDATGALFPYVTDDRLHAAAGTSGPVTAFRVRSDDGDVLWEPFAPRAQTGTNRSVSKAVTSHSVGFEERHVGLDLSFSYRWASAQRFGFVRSAVLRNDGPARVTLDVVDGLVDLLPYGLEPSLYHRFSNLTNAYKRSEVVDDATGLAVYSLESPVSDQPEPEEVLRANVVWSCGLDGDLDLHTGALDAFRRGADSVPRHRVTGRPGAYLRRGVLQLEAGESATWHVIGDVAHDHADLAELRHTLRAMGDVGDVGDVSDELDAATGRTRERIATIVTSADAAQHTGDPIACAHHVSNVIYNVMRGGVPLDGYRVDTGDFGDFVRQRNTSVAARHAAWLAALPDTIERRDLIAGIADRGDPHLVRLGDEYLPFTFSRRHGDPSRPWNQFTIDVTGPDDEPVLSYEGNWRDVFQNWEALCASFPEYLPGVISVFVNASTADGHNPYRIARHGIDWETPDPHDPWANIGYWGDHQIAYLLRLLEACESFLPGAMTRRLTDRVHTYADVPYRIAPYADLVRDPKSTIAYDTAAADRVERRVAGIGADGKLLVGHDGEPLLVSLVEKLLVTALARLSNFVPGGGIWMNTQRPEWNDANNALVGHGLSMVTLFHLRRFLEHIGTLVAPLTDDVTISTEVAMWLDGVLAGLDRAPAGASSEQDRDRRTIMDRLGSSASEYRSTVYSSGLSGTTSVSLASIVSLCELAISHLDATIAGCRRDDGLVHAYNLVELPADDVASIVHLPAMLEGQVAALTPGILPPAEQADLLDALFASPLYCPDRRTFVLAATEAPPPFLDKNVIEEAVVRDNALLVALLDAGDRSIVVADVDGRYRFAPELVTAPELGAQLDRLASSATWAELVDACRDSTLAAYERVFGHRSQVGRSGLMHAYEGIGSVYWHMVTKLLLAIQEAWSDATLRDEHPTVVARLEAFYWRTRDGLGVNKTPEEYGAIPIDPYSHTPAHAGAQQPGMTGAVKEEILSRPRELGVRVESGRIAFDGRLVRSAEWLDRPATWTVDVEGHGRTSIELDAGSVASTLCQVPIVVSAASDGPSIAVEFADGRSAHHDGDRLDPTISAAIFGRTGDVSLIRAAVPDVAD